MIEIVLTVIAAVGMIAAIALVCYLILSDFRKSACYISTYSTMQTLQQLEYVERLGDKDVNSITAFGRKYIAVDELLKITNDEELEEKLKPYFTGGKT